MYKLNGKTVSREEFLADGESKLEEVLASGEAPGGHAPGAWPLVSTALQVHPRQIPAVLERNRRAGLNIEYTSKGKPVLMDRGMRRDLLRVEKMHDHHGGYGD